MGRQPCCDKVGLKKGPWTAEEDKKLINFILTHGQCCWRAVPKLAGLLRCGKSCRLRWTNYLRPDLKRGLLSEYEETMVIDLHAKLGNRWSKIASHLAGRTDNEIKNHWNTHIKKKLRKMGIDPLTHKPLSGQQQQQSSSSSSSSSLPHLHQVSINTSTDEDCSNGEQQQLKETTVNLIQVTAPVISAVTEDNAAANEVEMELLEAASMMMMTKQPLQVAMDSFCVDEVPLIEPYEILISDQEQLSSIPSSNYINHSTSTAATTNHHYESINISQLPPPNPTNMTSSSSSSSSSCDNGSPSIFNDFQLPTCLNWSSPAADITGAYNTIDHQYDTYNNNTVDPGAAFWWDDEDFNLDWIINNSNNNHNNIQFHQDLQDYSYSSSYWKI